MTNIICITSGTRPRLLEQTLRTLRENTPTDQYNLTIIAEGSERMTMECVELCDGMSVNLLRLVPACNIIGRLKNLGAYWSERQFGRGEWLCICDDDLSFRLGWLQQMQTAVAEWNQLRIIGGNRHPYHQPNGRELEISLGGVVEPTDAVAGYLHFMRWSTWDKFGPYADNQKGLGASEDYVLCRNVVDAGGKVGYVSPPCVYHTGITNSEGKPILGAELIERAEGVLYL